MSSVVLAGSSSGTLTIAAPAAAEALRQYPLVTGRTAAWLSRVNSHTCSLSKRRYFAHWTTLAENDYRATVDSFADLYYTTVMLSQMEALP